MVAAEETHQIGNQGDAQKHGQAEKQDADDFAKAAFFFRFLLGFLRFGIFAFLRFVALFRGFLFGFLLFLCFFSYDGLLLQQL